MKALPVLLLATLLPTPPVSAASREPRRLLERQAQAIALPQVLASADAFRPYPTVADRAAWAGVPEERRRAFVAEAEKQLATEWAVLPATRFLDYVRDGNRGRYESLLFSRRGKLADLVLGELVEGKGRFPDAIADGVWLICEETYWGVPGPRGRAEARRRACPTSTSPPSTSSPPRRARCSPGRTTCWASGSTPSHPLVRERLRLEVDRRILTPCLERDDFWWMGFIRRARSTTGTRGSTPTGWRASSSSSATPSAGGARWRRSPGASTASSTPTPTTAAATRGRATGAGPGRRSSTPWSCSTRHRRRLDVYREPVVREIGQYIARAYIDGDYFVNFADASAKVKPEPELVFRYGRAVGDDALAGFGAFLAARRGPLRPGGRRAVREPGPRPAGAPRGEGPRRHPALGAARRRRLARPTSR